MIAIVLALATPVWCAKQKSTSVTRVRVSMVRRVKISCTALCVNAAKLAILETSVRHLLTSVSRHLVKITVSAATA